MKRNACLLAAAGLVFAVLSGCTTVGPDYAAPETEVPDAWYRASTAGIEAGEASLQTWWDTFNDPVLASLVDEAQTSNRTLAGAAARVLVARAQLGIAEGVALPRLTATGASKLTRQSRDLVPSRPSPSGLQTVQGILAAGSAADALRLLLSASDQEEPGLSGEFHSYGFNAAWEPDFWGRIARSVESAEASVEASVESYRDVLVLVLAQVAIAYIDIRTLQERLALAELNRTLQEETLALTRNRFEAGLEPQIDVRQAELNLANTRALVPSLQGQLEQRINALALLLGTTPDAELMARLAPEPLPEAVDVAALRVPAEALRQRPDIRAAERLLAAQTARIGIAQAELYPTFSLGGTLTLEATRFDNVFDRNNFVYNIGPQFRWRLFEGGSLRARIALEEALTEESRVAYEQTVLSAIEEVESALAAYGREVERERELRAAVRAAQRSVEQVNVVYLAGLVDFQNVLDLQRSLTSVQDQHAASRGQVLRNLVTLYRALGGGWHETPAPGTPAAETAMAQGA